MNDNGKKKTSPLSVPVQAPVKEMPRAVGSRWGDWKTWLNIIFLFIALEIAVYSVEQAHWITPQPSLTLVLFLSLTVVRVLTAFRLPGAVVHVLAVVAGILVTLWQAVVILPAGSGLGSLFGILGSWWRGGAALAGGDEQILFGVFLAFLTWIVGYLSAWFVLRRNNAWVAVALGIVVIIVNLSNLPEKNYFFFTIYLLAAVLLIIQTRIVGQQSSDGKAAAYSGRSLFYLVVSLLCITVLAVSISWVTPQLRVPAIQNAIAAGLPWKQDLQESGLNILNAVPSKKSVSTTSKLQELGFGRYWHTGEDIKFIVESSRPAYWQMVVYDTYSSDGWMSSPAEELLMEKKTRWEDEENGAGREKLEYEVTAGIDTDALLLTGDFVSSEMPVLARMGVEGEITSVRAPRVLSAGESYTVRSYVNDPAATDLSAAGGDYPDSIKAVYLQLPPDFPADIRRLSENITREADSPYEMVVAVDEYLSSNMTYSLEVGEAPEGADAVEVFLFTQKRGFCLHFASAMAVMLRSVGVPARLAVGYLPGEPGKEKGEYLLRDRNYHAWPQVYFPGHGWVDIEATPGSTGSRAPDESPLVSVPEIRASPSWDVWFLPPGAFPQLPDEIPASTPSTRPARGGKLNYADELGRALIIIFGILFVFAFLFGLMRIARSFASRRLWDIDRERPASSAYYNLCQLAAMMRVSPEPQQTPLEFSAMLASVIPEKSKELDYIVRAHMEKRFGPDKGKPGLYEEAEILKARVSVYNALLRRMGVMQKLLGKGDRG